MGQKGYSRVVVAAAQVLITFLVVTAAGTWIAAAEDQRGVRDAQAELGAAHHEFLTQVQGGLAEGTPKEMLAELVVREESVRGRTEPRRSFLVDGRVASDARHAAADIRRITEDARLREIDVEESLAQQLGIAFDAMHGDLVSARDIGVDTAAYDRFLVTAISGASQLRIPKSAQASLDQTHAVHAQLRQAIADKNAADQAVAAAAVALQAAHQDADYERRRANGDLTQAQSLAVLDVAGVAAAIADLEHRYPTAVTTDDFNAFAAAYAAQARVLENLLYTRSSAFGLLAQARNALARAQGAGADVNADAAILADLGNQLAGASNLAALQAISGQLSIEIRNLNAAYQDARSRPFVPAGAIVANVPFYKQQYSLSCEEAAVQMALAKYGINVSQDQVFSVTGIDRRLPYYDSGGTLHWGNPYSTFVGNPMGYENENSGDRSGYGTYYPMIAKAAGAFGGKVQQSGEGIAPSVVYAAAHNQQPSVVWVAYAYQPQQMRYMITFDNQTVMYGAPVEHAVTVGGWAPGYLLLNNPHSHPEWIDATTFERAYAMFNNMAVILKP